MLQQRAMLVFLLFAHCYSSPALTNDFETLITKGMAFSELARGSDAQNQGLTKDILN